jgi:photosystem II stability/assembly factor-like uncharacterized protein
MVSPNRGWAVSRSTVLRTIDGGRKWRVVLNLRGARWPFDFSLTADGPLRAWVLKRGPHSSIIVLSSENGGVTWRSSAPLPFEKQTGPSLAADISFPNRRQGWLLRIGRPRAGVFPYELYRTHDGGFHWRPVEAKTSLSDSRHSLPGCVDAVTFDTGRSGWATGECDLQPGRAILYHTVDGGHTWMKLYLARPPGFSIFTFATYPPRFHGDQGILPVYLYRPTAYVLYVTNDHGRHWQPTTPVHVFTSSLGPSIATSGASHIWLAANRSLYASSDRGRHWSKIYSGPAFASTPQLQFLDLRHGFLVPAVPQPRSLVTKNGGRVWRVLRTTLIPVH